MIDLIAETCTRGIGQPDFPDRSAFEEEVDGYVDVGNGEDTNDYPDGPYVAPLGWNEAKKEEGDRKSDEKDGEEICRFGRPQPFERLRDVSRWHINDMSAKSKMVGVDQEGIGDNGYELPFFSVRLD